MTFVLCCFGTLIASAQEENEKIVKDFLHTIVFKKDGTTVEGYLQNSFEIGGYTTRYYHRPCTGHSSMKIKPNNKVLEHSINIDNSDIDSMVTWFDEYPQIKQKWEPQSVNLAFGNSDPMIEDHPAMLQLVYRGEHVKGYLTYQMFFDFKYLFMIDDMPYAKAFLKPNQKLNNRRKETLLETFYMYPEMDEYIKGLTKSDVKDDPFCILRKLDEIISESRKIEGTGF